MDKIKMFVKKWWDLMTKNFITSWKLFPWVNCTMLAAGAVFMWFLL